MYLYARQTCAKGTLCISRCRSVYRISIVRERNCSRECRWSVGGGEWRFSNSRLSNTLSIGDSSDCKRAAHYSDMSESQQLYTRVYHAIPCHTIGMFGHQRQPTCHRSNLAVFKGPEGLPNELLTRSRSADLARLMMKRHRPFKSSDRI